MRCEARLCTRQAQLCMGAGFRPSLPEKFFQVNCYSVSFRSWIRLRPLETPVFVDIPSTVNLYAVSGAGASGRRIHAPLW